MSPRAAWQLEAMGFTDVHDFVDGKVEWLVTGFPVEGQGPHYAMAGEVASNDNVHTCLLGSKMSEVAAEMRSSESTFCLVLNDEAIVLGRLRGKALDAQSDVLVEDVMETGPTTVRPSEPAKPLLERMNKRQVPEIVVTTKGGKLVGVASRDNLAGLVERAHDDKRRFP